MHISINAPTLTNVLAARKQWRPTLIMRERCEEGHRQQSVWGFEQFLSIIFPSFPLPTSSYPTTPTCRLRTELRQRFGNRDKPATFRLDKADTHTRLLGVQVDTHLHSSSSSETPAAEHFWVLLRYLDRVFTGRKGSPRDLSSALPFEWKT